ncbi:MAG: flagellar hook-basal body complex protein FliE [Lachnospiraceae bacterium]|nr:flagellar hook-basal body complex protein FliE [Lachnospiraceae bacterium]
MEITSFYNLSSGAIRDAAKYSSVATISPDTKFGTFLDAALNQINETNGYLQDQENEEIKYALGLTDNTHDLAIAQSKAQTSLSYTVALRDRFLESYREIMQMQI